MTIVEEGVSSVYAAPGERGSVATYRPRYGHYIGGEFVEPIKGQYFENITPVTGKPFCEVGRGTVEDIDRAVDVAWKAFQSARAVPDRFFNELPVSRELPGHFLNLFWMNSIFTPSNFDKK